jgi:hypothetical protein
LERSRCLGPREDRLAHVVVAAATIGIDPIATLRTELVPWALGIGDPIRERAQRAPNTLV